MARATVAGGTAGGGSRGEWQGLRRSRPVPPRRAAGRHGGHAECGVALGDLAERSIATPCPGDARLDRRERAVDPRTPSACAVSP